MRFFRQDEYPSFRDDGNRVGIVRTGRFSRMLARIFDAQYPELSKVSPDIVPTFPVVRDSAPENYYDRGDLICSGGDNSPASVGNNSYVWLGVTRPGIFACVSHIIISPATVPSRAQIMLTTRALPAASGSDFTQRSYTDARLLDPVTAGMTQGTDPDPAAAVRVSAAAYIGSDRRILADLYVSGNAIIPVNAVIDDRVNLVVCGLTLNMALSASFIWYERRFDNREAER